MALVCLLAAASCGVALPLVSGGVPVSAESSPTEQPPASPSIEASGTEAPTATRMPRATLAPTATTVPTWIRYVASTGDDAGPGISSQPWRTIQKAADTLSPGQTAIVLAGDYPERVSLSRSGYSGAPITFQAQGTVTMRGFTVRADYIALIGFDISNTPDHPEDGWGIFVEGGECLLLDNYVHFATRGGIRLSGSPGATSRCVVRGNRLYRNAQVGIEVHGRGHLIEGNEVWRTIQYHPDASDPSFPDADGIRFFGAEHVFRGNYIHDISYDDPENVSPHIDCFQTWADADHEAATDIILEQNHCEALTSHAPGENGHGFMLEDASNLLIRNNLVRAYGGVNTAGGGNSRLTIVQNDFVNNLSFPFDPAGVLLVDCPNSLVKNNIFLDQPHHHLWIAGSSAQGLEAGNNLVYRSDGLEIWGSQYPGDIWEADPRFINPASGDFHLQSGSPAIDAGAAVLEVTNDFEGNARPQGLGYDIGAFETAG